MGTTIGNSAESDCTAVGDGCEDAAGGGWFLGEDDFGDPGRVGGVIPSVDPPLLCGEHDLAAGEEVQDLQDGAGGGGGHPSAVVRSDDPPAAGPRLHGVPSRGGGLEPEPETKAGSVLRGVEILGRGAVAGREEEQRERRRRRGPGRDGAPRPADGREAHAAQRGGDRAVDLGQEIVREPLDAAAAVAGGRHSVDFVSSPERRSR